MMHEAPEEYRLIARPEGNREAHGFTYRGMRFDQSSFHLVAGLCAVDSIAHVETTLQTLQSLQLTCTRMGAYKPRTNPYSFQGLGENCLSNVFELCGKYGMRVVCMEITHERHLEEINRHLDSAGNPTGVVVQIGTRNSQNFELLKAVGQQQTFPVLYKRGYGITLTESLHAVEYIAHSGNNQIIFCLRGVKSILGEPHRNLPDVAQIPTVHRLTQLPVCFDPSHALGARQETFRGYPEIFDVSAQAVIAGANALLVDVHPNPSIALVDGPQALTLAELASLVQDLHICREAYLQRIS